MTYPNVIPITTKEPTILASGIATIGTIPRALFIGDIEEQSLAINVEGKGIVLIVGCSHQTVTKIIDRAKKIFKEPIYGIIGGLHYPVPTGRLYIAGINGQRYFASGNGPFQPLQMEEVKEEMNLIAAQNPQFVAVGGHDSSDEVITMFAERFGQSYYALKVGEIITVQ